MAWGTNWQWYGALTNMKYSGKKDWRLKGKVLKRVIHHSLKLYALMPALKS